MRRRTGRRIYEGHDVMIRDTESPRRLEIDMTVSEGPGTCDCAVLRRRASTLAFVAIGAEERKPQEGTALLRFLHLNTRIHNDGMNIDPSNIDGVQKSALEIYISVSFQSLALKPPTTLPNLLPVAYGCPSPRLTK